MLQAPAPTTVTERLGLILDWYKGMISERSGRLVYACDPEADVTIADGSPIRDIASIWAQRLEDCPSRERGGFGHSLIDRTQRIDVTGHVVGGFIKSARNRVGA